ncbi:MAG: molybdopterin converting factor subunit 1 [Phycisphaerales bacterium]|jgi:molybdopterin converting factor subunit 1|nr:molybdopterin converting factor subunit 1 [Phycisphaerales bacterium]
MTITVQYFAILASTIDQRAETLAASDVESVKDVLDLLSERHDIIAQMRSSLAVAVNEHYADASHPVAAGDRVAIIPPVSGG